MAFLMTDQPPPSVLESQEPATPEYEYTPLLPSSKEIRLVTLLPGGFSAEIRVSIHITILSEDSIPEFEALSYVWGSTENLVGITVQDSGDTVLGVTQNLATALPYLRYKEKPRILWIDAICVNQQDLKERSQQVLRMPEIYTLASRVIAWLGPAQHDSSLAMKSIIDLAPQVEYNWVSSTLTPSSQSSVDTNWADKSVDLPYPDNTLLALARLLDRSWFERLWIWQEIHLANETATMLCGFDHVLWQDFRKSIACLALKYKVSPGYIPSLRSRLSQVVDLCHEVKYDDVTDLLEKSRMYKCTDPRDRAFALLGMNEAGRELSLEPNYESSIMEVYKEVTLAEIERKQSLKILQLCGTNAGSGDLPSWIPDLRVPPTVDGFYLTYCSCDSAPSFKVVEGSNLKAAGVFYHQIAAVQDIDACRGNIGQEGAAEVIRELAARTSCSYDLVNNEEALTYFCNTLCGGSYAERFLDISTEHPTQSEGREIASFILNYPDFNGDWARLVSETQNRFPSAHIFLTLVWNLTLSRTLFSTTSGDIGLGPKLTRPGDLITVLLGTTTPLLLRPTTTPDGTNNHHLLIGDCYVQSIQFGSALLGPLPPSIRNVLRFYPPLGVFYSAFVNTAADGDVQIEDPRLGGYLPPGWKRETHEHEQAYMVYCNEETGLRTRKHPALMPDPLRELGVDICDIVLV